MKVSLFGATGMVGQGVLRECLNDNRIERVLSISHSSTNQRDPKLHEPGAGGMKTEEALTLQVVRHADHNDSLFKKQCPFEHQ
jgi:aspartate-semialdehyde dehydrogenase